MIAPCCCRYLPTKTLDKTIWLQFGNFEKVFLYFCVSVFLHYLSLDFGMPNCAYCGCCWVPLKINTTLAAWLSDFVEFDFNKIWQFWGSSTKGNSGKAKKIAKIKISSHKIKKSLDFIFSWIGSEFFISFFYYFQVFAVRARIHFGHIWNRRFPLLPRLLRCAAAGNRDAKCATALSSQIKAKSAFLQK